ncbi:MAG: D-alanine--D-alanine ligase [bacterium]
MKKLRKIAVLAGVSETEREISLKTADAVFKALKRLKYRAEIVDIGTGNFLKKILACKPDFCFIACHGRIGEDGVIQGFLDALKIPYSCSGVLASSAGMNKMVSKKIFSSLGVKVLPDICLVRGRRYSLSKLRSFLPVVVKPVSEGSAIGMSIVKKLQDLERAVGTAFECDDKVMVEKYVRGREFTVGWLAGAVLPVLEIVPANEFYDYESKYVPGKSRHIVPAEIDKRSSGYLSASTERICGFLGIRGMARVDFVRSAHGKFYALEINTIPGMTGTSLLPEAAAAAGIPFDEAVLKIIKDTSKITPRKSKIFRGQVLGISLKFQRENKK